MEYIKNKDYEKLIGVKDSLESVLQVMELKGTHVQFDFNPMNTL